MRPCARAAAAAAAVAARREADAEGEGRGGSDGWAGGGEGRSARRHTQAAGGRAGPGWAAGGGERLWPTNRSAAGRHGRRPGPMPMSTAWSGPSTRPSARSALGGAHDEVSAAAGARWSPLELLRAVGRREEVCTSHTRCLRGTKSRPHLRSSNLLRLYAMSYAGSRREKKKNFVIAWRLHSPPASGRSTVISRESTLLSTVKALARGESPEGVTNNHERAHHKHHTRLPHVPL